MSKGRCGSIAAVVLGFVCTSLVGGVLYGSCTIKQCDTSLFFDVSAQCFEYDVMWAEYCFSNNVSTNVRRIYSGTTWKRDYGVGFDCDVCDCSSPPPAGNTNYYKCSAGVSFGVPSAWVAIASTTMCTT
jgi:hypothetical protein